MMSKKSEKGNIALAFSAPLLWFILIWLFVAACTQHEEGRPVAEVGQKAPATVRRTLFSELPLKDQPKITLLDTVPKPLVIQLTGANSINKPANNSGTRTNDHDTSYNSLISEARGKGFFTTLTTDDGLSLDQVYCSYKDKWGNLWFGTNGGGVSKYDGKNFTTYTTAHGLANNIIWCITQDHQGNIWFGTDGSGASKYDGESFTTYTTAQGLPDNVVFSIVEDKNKNLWFGTLKGGVSKWDGRSFTNFSSKQGLANNAVKTILEDSKGNFWFGTLGGGVSRWNGSVFSNYSAKDGLAADRVWSIAEDNSGNIWFGTEGKGLFKYDGAVFTNYNVLKGEGDAIQCIAKDNKGSLWFGTQNSGLIKYNGKNFTSYSTVNGIANSQIRAITNDESGNLWLSTFGSGVCKFAGASFTNFTTAQGLPANVIFSIEEDSQGNLWLGTSDKGAYRFDGEQSVNLTQADGLARDEVYCIAKDSKNNLWFGTSGGGVSKFDGKSFTNYTPGQGLASNIVFSIVEDKQGNLWFGTSGGGVSKFDGKSFTNYTTTQGLAGNVVFNITQDRKGNLWLGTLDGGISKFDGTGFTNYTVDQGLSDNLVWDITEDQQGNLWIGTQNGLNLMPADHVVVPSENNNTPAPVFIHFTTNDGLPNNFITQVIEGSAGIMYVGTNLGVCELLPTNSKNKIGKNWSVGRIFNTQHGYPVKDVNAGLNAMYKDRNNIIWVGTGSDKTGLVRFEPAALDNHSNIASRVVINKIRINNEAVSWRTLQGSHIKNEDSVGQGAMVAEEIATYGKKLPPIERDSILSKFASVKFDGISKWYSLPQKLELPYYFNNVSFEFGAIETGKNFLVNYRYFLEGYDKEWSPPGRNTYANFGNINEGSYTFKVKAQGTDGVWGEPVSYSFKVLPPWWRTWWMYMVYVILGVTSILLFIWWKQKRLIEKHRILEHEVAIATKQVREEAEKVREQKKKAEDTLKELKETQAQLIQSEKMASLGELTAGIAHEIQNPLNFVNNFSEVNHELIGEMNEELSNGNITEASAIASDIKDNLDKIMHHGKRANDIVKGMLQHSRNSSGVKEPVDINKLADEYLRLAYHGHRVKDKSSNYSLKTQYDETIGEINIVPQDIGRVILNLITNAFYAVDEKKDLQHADYEPTVFVSTKKVMDGVEIIVGDNGKGMPEKVLDKIFQPFFTTKPTGKGTGLGLSLSYDIVKAHGGNLLVNTRENEGTIFTIQLPASN